MKDQVEVGSLSRRKREPIAGLSCPYRPAYFRIRSITLWHSLSPPSSTRIPVDWPCGFSTCSLGIFDSEMEQEKYGLTMFRLSD